MLFLHPTRVLALQVKLLESYKKVAKDDVRRDAAAGKCDAMSEQDMAARQWELAEQHRAWLEALEHENLITYRKQAGSVSGQEDIEREMSLESKSDWSAEGMESSAVPWSACMARKATFKCNSCRGQIL